MMGVLRRQVGSLDLLFNVTGLVRGVGAGLADLFQLPLSGLSSASLSAFVSGIWSGWASLFSHVSGWTLTSVGGFSASVARLLKQVHLSPDRHRCRGAQTSWGQSVPFRFASVTAPHHQHRLIGFGS